MIELIDRLNGFVRIPSITTSSGKKLTNSPTFPLEINASKETEVANSDEKNTACLL